MDNAGIKDILSDLDGDLQRVDDQMKLILSSDVRMVDKVVRYIVKHKGKTLRPILTILTARLFDKPNQQTIQAAVIVELLHTATLVHDDVVDEAQVRRGFLSINAIWKNKVSVLVGDYLLAKALSEMLDLQNFDILGILSKVAKRMSRGELLQAAKARKLNITEDIYFDMIGDKTGALIGACCELAAVTSRASVEQREALCHFGEKLGLSFQIRDDILDFDGKKSLLGKPTMGDVKEKKITLPLIHAIRSSADGNAQKIVKMIRRGVKPGESRIVLDFIHRYNGIEYAMEIANKLKTEALEHLYSFSDSTARRSLEKFAEFAVTRNR